MQIWPCHLIGLQKIAFTIKDSLNGLWCPLCPATLFNPEPLHFSFLTIVFKLDCTTSRNCIRPRFFFLCILQMLFLLPEWFFLYFSSCPIITHLYWLQNWYLDVSRDALLIRADVLIRPCLPFDSVLLAAVQWFLCTTSCPTLSICPRLEFPWRQKFFYLFLYP